MSPPVPERREENIREAELLHMMVTDLVQARVNHCPHHQDLMMTITETATLVRGMDEKLSRHDVILYGNGVAGTGLVYEAVQRKTEAKRRDRWMWFLLGGVLPFLAFISPWLKYLLLDK